MRTRFASFFIEGLVTRVKRAPKIKKDPELYPDQSAELFMCSIHNRTAGRTDFVFELGLGTAVTAAAGRKIEVSCNGSVVDFLIMNPIRMYRFSRCCSGICTHITSVP